MYGYSQVTQVDDGVTQRIYIYTYGYSRVTQVDDEVTQCICMYGYSQVTHIDDEVTQCLHTHMVRSWVRFTKFGFPNGSTCPPPPPAPHLEAHENLCQKNMKNTPVSAAFGAVWVLV